MEIDDYYQSYFFGELMQSLFYIYSGRIKKINVDYLVRQSHLSNTYSKLNERPIIKKRAGMVRIRLYIILFKIYLSQKKMN